MMVRNFLLPDMRIARDASTTDPLSQTGLRHGNFCVPEECRALARLAEFIAIGIKGLSELVERVSMTGRNVDACPEYQLTGQPEKSPVLSVVSCAEVTAPGC